MFSTRRAHAPAFCSFVFIALVAVPAAALGPYLVADLVEGADPFGLEVEWAGRHLGETLLVTSVGQLGLELYRLDDGDLVPITDICPGSCGTFPRYFDAEEAELDFEFYGEDLVFVTRDHFFGGPVVQEGLWRLPVAGGPATLLVEGPTSRPTVVGDRLVFSRVEENFSLSLWSWDGDTLSAIDEARFRAADFVRVGSLAFYFTDIGPTSRLYVTDGVGSRLVTEIPGSIRRLDRVGDRLAIDIDYGSELWTSDGTEEGTTQLIDFPQQGSHFATSPDRLLYVFGDPMDGSQRLWSTDGTADGSAYLPTHCVFDCSAIDPRPLVTPGGLVYFIGDRPGDLSQPSPALWRTDGTPVGTFRLTDVGPVPGIPTAPDDLAVVGERVFLVTDIAGRRELWTSDGTVAGTVAVRDLDGVTRLVGAAGGRAIVLTYSESNEQVTVLASDGTDAGTLSLVSTPPGIRLSSDSWAGGFGDEMLFSLYEAGNIERLWRTDGTVSGTRPLGAIAESGRSSFPRSLTAAGDSLYFVALVLDVPANRPLWRHRRDGITERVRFGLPDTVSILGTIGDRLIVFGRSELWATDGTAAGTRRLVELDTPHETSIDATPFGDGLLVVEEKAGTTQTLWHTDGTPQGTRQLTTIEFMLGASQVAAVHAAGDVAFVTLSYSPELWITDGTAEGTFVTTLPANVYEPEVLGDHLYFRSGSSLWTSDGTVDGTRVVVDASELSGLSGIGRLQATENALYFATFGTNSSLDLWVTTGTRESVRRVGNLPCGDSCAIGEAEHATLGDAIVFAWDDGSGHGEEPWSVSLQEAPRQIADLCPGTCSSRPSAFGNAGDRVYFSASDDARGQEPWRTDGSAAGTYPLGDVAPGIASSGPEAFTFFADQVYFSASTPEVGNELWTFDPVDGGATSLLADSRFEVGVRWRTDESEVAARMQPFSGDTSFFWFFGPDNIELMVKVLDGRSINDAFWVFYGALSDVEYWIDVRDRHTGRVETYYNPPGESCGRNDTLAFPELGVVPDPGTPSATRSAGWPRSAASGATLPKTDCVPAADALCLQGGRFRVEVDWRASGASTDRGQAVTGTDETGYFWFFEPSNLELAVKVLDGRAINGKFWVFYGASTDVEYTLTVTDSETGATATYVNPEGEICGQFDTNAF